MGAQRVTRGHLSPRTVNRPAFRYEEHWLGITIARWPEIPAELDLTTRLANLQYQRHLAVDAFVATHPIRTPEDLIRTVEFTTRTLGMDQ